MSFRHDFIVNTWIGEWTNTWYLLIQLKQEWQASRGHVILQPLTLPSYVLISYQVCSSLSNGWRWWLRVTGPCCRSHDPLVPLSPSTRRWKHAGGGRKWLFPRKGSGLKTHLADGPSLLWQSENDFNKYSLPHLSQRWIPQSMPISKPVT